MQNLTNVPRGQSVKTTVPPQVDESLNNAGHLHQEMSKQLRDVQNSKPKKASHQSKGDSN